MTELRLRLTASAELAVAKKPGGLFISRLDDGSATERIQSSSGDVEGTGIWGNGTGHELLRLQSAGMCYTLQGRWPVG